MMIMKIIWHLLFVLLTAKVCMWIWKYFMLRKQLSAIPGPKLVPFLGLTWHLAIIPREDCLQWFSDLCSELKSGIILTWIGTKPSVVVSSPEYIELILSSTSSITKASAYDAFKPWMGNGLITSTGDTWFNHRRLLNHAFYPKVLEEYAFTIRKKTKILVSCIESRLSGSSGVAIEMMELTTKYTLDTICETAMGVDIDSQRKPVCEYVEALKTFARLSTERMFRFYLNSDGLYFCTSKGRRCRRAIETMQNLTSKMIQERQYKRRNGPPRKTVEAELDDFGIRKQKAFLDLLLDANETTENPLSIQEVREEVDTFVAAGHDTTGASICWALFAIGNEPEVQDKIFAEMKEVFGDKTAIASTQQLNQLKYLDRVIKEVLRLYPSIPAIARCLEMDTELGEYRIPKDITLQINIFQLHRNPEVWENPDKFDPDRFLPENIQLKNRYAYIPFSTGPRHCIGKKFGLLEVKIVLTELLRRWRISSVLKPCEMKMISNFVLRPYDDKIQLYFTPYS